MDDKQFSKDFIPMTNLGNPEATATASGLTDKVVVEYLKACQAIVVEHAGQCFAAFYKALSAQLSEFVEQAKSNQEQADLAEQQRLLQQQAGEVERYFLGYLGEGFVKFKRHELATSTGEEKYQGDMLSLVDNADLEETIAISSMTKRAENHYAESLWGLNQRLAVLNGGGKVDDRSNPLGPVQYCESLRKSLRRSALNTKSKIIAYKVFDRELMPKLVEPLDEVNQYLQDKGVLPNLRYRAGSGAATSASPASASFQGWDSSSQTGDVDSNGSIAGADGSIAGADGSTPVANSLTPQAGVSLPGMMPVPDASLPTDQYQGYLVNAIRTLQGHLGSMMSPVSSVPASSVPVGNASASAAVPPSGTPQSPMPMNVPVVGGAAAPGGHPGLVYSNQQLVGALQALQTQAMAVTGQQLQQGTVAGLQPQAVTALNQQFIEQLQSQAEEDGQEIDPSDMHTIDLVGMLFEYMLSDENLPDSVKALLSYLHTPFLKIAFIDKGFFEQTEHPARLLLNNMAEAGVKWVSNDGSSQYEIYDKIKAIVSCVLEEFKNDVRLFAELLLDFSGYTKKISRRQELMERRAMEKVQGEEKLREVKIRVNEEVRARIDNRELPSAVLLMLLQPWSDYLAFVLLRYSDQSDSWQRAIQVVDDVLWSIEPKQQEADKARQLELQDRLLDALEVGFETIGYDQAKGKKLLEALYSLQKMALQSKVVEPAPKPMRNKLEALAAKKAGKSTAVEDQPTPEEARMVENLKMIEFGTWFEFEGGRRLKVAWYNSKTLHYMLVDQMGKKVAMKSGLELARDMLAHKAKVIAGSSKPFFERALENIFQSLNAKAGELRAEEGEEV